MFRSLLMIFTILLSFYCGLGNLVAEETSSFSDSSVASEETDAPAKYKGPFSYCSASHRVFVYASPCTGAPMTSSDAAKLFYGSEPDGARVRVVSYDLCARWRSCPKDKPYCNSWTYGSPPPIDLNPVIVVDSYELGKKVNVDLTATGSVYIRKDRASSSGYSVDVEGYSLRVPGTTAEKASFYAVGVLGSYYMNIKNKGSRVIPEEGVKMGDAYVWHGLTSNTLTNDRCFRSRFDNKFDDGATVYEVEIILQGY